MDSNNKDQNMQKLGELRERAIKVTEALYRTTDLFSDAEPLKWSLRDSAVKILNTISDISSNPTYQELRSAQTLEKMIGSLCFKLDLAVGGTFVARANFDVLGREYKSLMEQINHVNFFGILLLEESKKNSHDVPGEFALSGTEDKRTLVVQKSPIDTLMSNAIQEHEHNVFSDRKESAISNSHKTTDEFRAPRISSVAPKIQGNNHPPHNNIALSDRKDNIVKLIKERGPSSVGDMRKLINMSLSEKTIQRDLNALAEAGILKREGEKRWRRYFV